GEDRRRLRRVASLENAGRPPLTRITTTPHALRHLTLRGVVRGSHTKQPRYGYGFDDWVLAVQGSAEAMSAMLSGGGRHRRAAVDAAAGLFCGYTAFVAEKKPLSCSRTGKAPGFEEFLADVLSWMDDRVKDWPMLNFLADEAFAAWVDTPDSDSKQRVAQALVVGVPKSSVEAVLKLNVRDPM
ncbi:hypothetical protein, partial [Paraburkholderia sp. SIMBA_054]|uniref:hypothetical protein n=1 Tax=Paraburkholderia sp. SIMBA_054 TaxID=3085795 RepID=UPI00397863B1